MPTPHPQPRTSGRSFVHNPAVAQWCTWLRRLGGGPVVTGPGDESSALPTHPIAADDATDHGHRPTTSALPAIGIEASEAFCAMAAARCGSTEHSVKVGPDTLFGDHRP